MSSWQGGPPSQWGPGGPQQGPGGPQWGQQAPGTSTPDWGELAAEAERKRKRRRLLLLGGGALATLALGTVVALAIVRQGGDDGGQPSDRATGSVSDPAAEPADTPQPTPSFEETSLPPLPQPKEFITDADKDIAPFTTDGFYAGDTMQIDGREYTKVATAATEECAEGTVPELGAVLDEHGCTALLRATYTAADGATAVTIGVARFATETDAAAAKTAAVRHITPLTSEGAPTFCQRGGCRTTRNQIGRYAYFTIAGNSDNTPDSGEDTPAQQAARDGNTHAYARVVQRGESQASASASALVDERRKGNN